MTSKLTSLAGVFLLAITLLASCGGGGEKVTPGPTQDQTQDVHPWGVYSGISVDFVDRTYRVSGGGTDDPKDTDPIFYHIASARQSLDVAVPRIDRQEVVDALLAAANSVHIRFLTERAFAEDPAFRPYVEQLRSHPNISVRTDADGTPRLMHARFLVIDGARVVTGSYNWSEEASERTMGDLLVINDSRIASVFTNQFNQMFVEGRFGVDKRDATPHSFQVAGGLGAVDVYFGPTNRLDQIIQSEIEQSAHVAAVVEQFSDSDMANFISAWVSGNVGMGSPEQRSLHMIINDIGMYGSSEENSVYDFLANLVLQGDEDVPAAVVLNQPPTSDWVNIGAQASHKVVFADHFWTSRIPAVVVSTGNWSDQGFSLNDEVMVILRGLVLASKYHYLTTLQIPHFGENFITNDVREIEQLLMMYPFITNNAASPTVPRDPALADVSTGLIHGKVDNFQREFSYQDENGNLVNVLLDVQWEVEGEYYFGGTITPYVNPLFDEDERTNPGKNYILVVPAGTLTVRAVVVDDTGARLEAFEPTEKSVEVSPGGVVQVNFSITAPSILPGGGAPGGGAPGGGGGGGGGGLG